MFYKKLFVLITLYCFIFEFKSVGNVNHVNNSTQNPLGNVVPEDDSEEYSFLITNGYRPLRPTLSKHLVSIQYMNVKYFGSGHLCGGAIIKPRIILTAAHCLYDKNTQNLKDTTYMVVVAGTPKRLEVNKKTQISKVRRLVMHPFYHDQLTRNDIGIIILSSSIEEDNKTAQRIPLSSSTPPPNTRCIILGWGAVMENGPMPNEVLYIDVSILDDRNCKLFFDPLYYGMLCAADSNDYTKSACTGDSGGPMICNNILTGIVSLGLGCGVYPGIYTDVSSYIQWINETETVLKWIIEMDDETDSTSKLSQDITSLQAVSFAILLYCL